MIKLHGFAMSPNTRRAQLGLEEVGVPYEVVSVDLMAGEHRKPPYLELNPTARVPVLVHGDYVLWESNAILEYLAAEFPAKRLGPASSREMGDAARWMFMNASHLSPSMARIFAHTIRLPEEKRNPQIVEESRVEVDRCLKPLEQRLTGREWLLERITIADLSILPSMAVAPMIGVDLSRFPHIEAWTKRMAERPSWKKVYG